MKGKEEDEERNDNICRQRTDNQTDSSNTEATLIPCGSSGEWANNRGDSTIKEEDEEKKN